MVCRISAACAMSMVRIHHLEAAKPWHGYVVIFGVDAVVGEAIENRSRRWRVEQCARRGGVEQCVVLRHIRLSRSTVGFGSGVVSGRVGRRR